MTSAIEADARLLQSAVGNATQTRSLLFGRGILVESARVFAEEFRDRRVVVVADPRTFAAAGRDVEDVLRRARLGNADPLVLDDPELYAEWRFVERVRDHLAATDAIPVAVGSGTINDLVKLASHMAGRPYMVVATAASMDGYTAFGASITKDGSKETFQCPAPRAVVADIDIIRAAPEGMNASGYADLLAKITAGADWLLADALGVEPVDSVAWSMVQPPLREWLGAPGDVAGASPDAVSHLMAGLLMGGFAMQRAESSRPASGAEHQFSHLWDMEHHTHAGATPSHGFKVGIGTLASVALYERLLELPLEGIDPGRCARRWPSLPDEEIELGRLFAVPELADKAAAETRAKHPAASAIETQIAVLRREWPALRGRLRAQLIPFREVRGMLAAAGAAAAPEDIGICRARLRQSYRQAYHIRRRFTVLDLAVRTGLLDEALDAIFGDGGAFAATGLSPSN